MQRIGNKLIAEEGMTLTNGSAYGKRVYLAAGAAADEWREMTDEEAEEQTRELTDREALELLTEGKIHEAE